MIENISATTWEPDATGAADLSKKMRKKTARVRKTRWPWKKERRYGGGPVIARPAGRATKSGARFALFFTGVAWLVYLVEQGMRVAEVGLTPLTVIETLLYLLLVTLLTASASAYLLARIGYFERINNHRRVPRSTIDNYFDHTQPELTVLVPSYREEERIVRLTLLSAALQEYPNIRVVLLIDDPPHSPDPEHRELLENARGLIASLSEELEAPRREIEQALAAFERETTQEKMAADETLEQLAAHYAEVAIWFDEQKANLTRTDHIEEFFIIEVLERLANDLRTTAQALLVVAYETDNSISRRRVHQMYTRLLHIFQAEFSSFERKQFASLSHEPNKAMNLNSYIGLMGGAYCSASSPGGQVLIPAENRIPDLVIPDCDYILTLDADSLLLPEYCLRLVYFMEQEENQRVAIAQTPYSAYQGTPSRIERIAGATTDIQHIIHLGSTWYGATSWVGANAVIRKQALEDIKETYEESGFEIQRFISDKTVIEDTESTIDLRNKGWRLYNYPERLSYSATPPDFGALIIQRRRWANGGLVIFPKLFRTLFRRAEGVPRLSLAELFLRTNYLVSISWASIGLLLLLFYPFDNQLLSRAAVLTAVPYWWMMASDLKRTGYRRRDIFHVYGFNLLLLPVNLVGTIQSLVQVIGGQRTAFARTPKVKDRTVAPLLYLLLPLVLIVWSLWTLLQDIVFQNYTHGMFAAANTATMIFACLAFLGVRQIVVDIFMNLKNFIFRPVEVQPEVVEVPHWASVLYVGSSVPEEIKSGAPLAVALATQDMVTSTPNPEQSFVEERAALLNTIDSNHSRNGNYSNGR